jgi:hypothetical protein
MAVSPAALCFFLHLRTAVLRCRFRTEPPVRQAVIHAIRRCFVEPSGPDDIVTPWPPAARRDSAPHRHNGFRFSRAFSQRAG